MIFQTSNFFQTHHTVERVTINNRKNLKSSLPWMEDLSLQDATRPNSFMVLHIFTWFCHPSSCWLKMSSVNSASEICVRGKESILLSHPFSTMVEPSYFIQCGNTVGDHNYITSPFLLVLLLKLQISFNFFPIKDNICIIIFFFTRTLFSW